jgi:hypothetical protein
MTRPRRYPFPAVYLALLLPIPLGSDIVVRVGSIAGSAGIAALLNPPMFRRVLGLLLLTFASLLPLLALVQGTACWSQPVQGVGYGRCVVAHSGAVVLNTATLAAVVLLAATREARGSLLETVNQLGLPRTLRMIAIVAAAMVGEFRKAASRVFQAFTGTGAASPAASLRNVTVLPAMLAVMWAAVIKGAESRLGEQWGADAFWERYVPRGGARLAAIGGRDLLVGLWCCLVACLAVLR